MHIFPTLIPYTLYTLSPFVVYPMHLFTYRCFQFETIPTCYAARFQLRTVGIPQRRKPYFTSIISCASITCFMNDAYIYICIHMKNIIYREPYMLHI